MYQYPNQLCADLQYSRCDKKFLELVHKVENLITYKVSLFSKVNVDLL